jgi:translocator protein
MIMKNFIKIIVSIAICEFAGIIGSFFTTPAINNWYLGLIKPQFNPPNWLFAPVWTLLFLLMGVSLYLVWKNKFQVRNEIKMTDKKSWNPISAKLWLGSWKEENSLAIFVLQLILNIMWSVIFFGLKQPGVAFFEIIALWFAILYTIVNFYRISKSASFLLIPYLLWVSFASVLNFFIWILN